MNQIKRSEHHDESAKDVTKLSDAEKLDVLKALENGTVEHFFDPVQKGTRTNKALSCFHIEKIQGDQCRFTTSYFVGTDWIDEKNQLSLCISPKIENLDFIRIFYEALSKNENLEHLENLYEIQFDKPSSQQPPPKVVA